MAHMCVKFGDWKYCGFGDSDSKGRSGIMKNNKDSTEIKKTIKDSKVIRNLLNTLITFWV